MNCHHFPIPGVHKNQQTFLEEKAIEGSVSTLWTIRHRYLPQVEFIGKFIGKISAASWKTKESFGLCLILYSIKKGTRVMPSATRYIALKDVTCRLQQFTLRTDCSITYTYLTTVG